MKLSSISSRWKSFDLEELRLNKCLFHQLLYRFENRDQPTNVTYLNPLELTVNTARALFCYSLLLYVL